MRIVEGRGRNRKTIELPHGSVFKAAERKNPAECRETIVIVGNIIGVPIEPLPV